jgi:hypothetical protein
MNHDRRPTTEELALLGLTEGLTLPTDGQIALAVYFTGSSTSRAYVKHLERELGLRLFPGTLNLRLYKTIVLCQPSQFVVAGEQWEAVPVILNECAVGVHAWKCVEHDYTFLEVFAPHQLAPALGLKNGDSVFTRMLSGEALHRKITAL